MLNLTQGNVLWHIFLWLWLVWILIICPSSLYFAVAGWTSSGIRSRRCKKLAVSFASAAAISTFIFIFFLLLL